MFLFFFVFLTIETAVKGPSFKEKKRKKKKKQLKRVNQPEEVNDLGNIYVRKSMF